MIPVNLSTVISKIRFLSDQRRSEYANEEIVRSIMQGSLNDIYYVLAKTDENYFIEHEQVRMIPPGVSGGVNQQEIPKVYLEKDEARNGFKLILPNDFFKLRLLQYSYSGSSKVPFKPISISEMSRYQNISSSTGLYDSYSLYNRTNNVNRFVYVVMKDHLLCFPQGISNTNYLDFYYTPKAPDISTVQTVKLPFGIEEYLVFYTAQFIGLAENVDSRQINIEKEKWKKNIMDTFLERDSSFPRRIADTEDGQAFY